MIDMMAPRPLHWSNQPRGQIAGVVLGQLPPSLIPGLQVGKLDPEDGCLDLVQAPIHSQEAVLILVAGAMVAEEVQGLSELGVVGDHHPRFSLSPEVLGEIEAEAAQVPQAPRCLAVISGSVGL